MDFMTSTEMQYKHDGGSTIRISRCGYTGEDGFELSVPNKSILPLVE